MDEQATGIDRIAAERDRQVQVELYSIDDDYDNNKDDQLALAAACYAIPAHRRVFTEKGIPVLWDWDDAYWRPKPENRIRELEKAGALIAAEIDRLLRKQAP